jgi:hypothetical protein
MEMPFGKYLGQPVATLPRRYLRWLLDNVDLKGRLKAEVQSGLWGVPVSSPQQQDTCLDVESVVQDIDTQLEEMKKADVVQASAIDSRSREDKPA